jgi:hypothetical protein
VSTDWENVIPVLIGQVVWNVTVVVTVLTVVRSMIRQEGDRVAATLAPLLKRVEQLGFLSAEQAGMNAQAIERVLGGQACAVVQVGAVPKQTADIVGCDAAIVAEEVKKRMSGETPPPVVKTEAAR